MDKERGLRPKHGGIEIRARIKGQAYSWFLNKPWNKTNVTQARRIRNERIAEIKSSIVDTGHLRTDNPLFQTVAQDYLDSQKTRRTESYVNSLRRDINSLWLPPLGLIPIKDIRVRDVRLADEAIDWPSPKRQQNARAMLRGVFAMAIMDEYIDTNPAEKLKPVSHQQPAIDPFTLEEKAAILAQLQGDAYLFYLLAFETGMRTGELMALRWSDIRNNRVYLERTMVLRTIKSMKIKQCRSVVLSQTAQDALKEAPRAISGDLWFNSQGTPLRDTRALRKAWHAAVKKAGVRYRIPYNCRHTRASLGLSAGQTPAWLAKQMGHDLRTFFSRYAEFVDSDNDAYEMAKLDLFGPDKKHQSGT